MPKAPSFWHQPNHPLRYALTPLSWLYQLGHLIRFHANPSYKAHVPVLCVGNLVAGGAGKTPAAIMLTQQLIAMGHTPHIISRGYGSHILNSLLVNDTHTATDVGDEALLLARHAPCWVGENRKESAINAMKNGADCLIMDDGLQNPSLYKNASMVVIDGGYGIGNGAIIPAGPMREPWKVGLKHANAVLIIGEDTHNLTDTLPQHIMAMSATINATIPESIKGKPLLAFCGIGRPQKFYDTLAEHKLDVIDTQDFPDHHPFKEGELSALWDTAEKAGAALVTTEKDWVRLPKEWQSKVEIVPITLNIAPKASVEQLLSALFS